MATTTEPGLRIMRFALALGVLTVPAALAHEHAGSAPSLVTIAIVALALGPFAWFATARTLERRSMTAAAVGAQLLSHSVFEFLHPSMHHGLSFNMIAAHAAAGLVTAAALAHADELLSFVAACLAPLRMLQSAVSPIPERPTLALAREADHLRRAPFLTTLRRRGPPVVA